jgi:hypothetical protein
VKQERLSREGGPTPGVLAPSRAPPRAGGKAGDGGDASVLDALVALHTHTDLLDAVNYTPGGSYEREVVQQCFRFFGSETEYAARDQHLLLRCLRTTEPKRRQEFFSEVRACRRRVQSGWERTDVAAVLTEADEFALFEHRALLAATQRRLAARGLSLRQAFHAFNSSRTGNMTSSELYSALRWLGFRGVSVAMVHALMVRLDSDGDGYLSCDDFVAGFAAGDPTADTSAMGTMAPGQQELVIPLQRVPELQHAASSGGPSSPGGSTSMRGPVVSMSEKELARFLVRLAPLPRVEAVARVREAGGGLHGADREMTVTQPTLSGSTKGGGLPVGVGHYIETPDAPSDDARILELRDTKASSASFWADASVRLHAALDQVMPPPARFQVVWSRGGSNPLTVWSAVPPTNEFVALGMVATATGATQRPPVDVVRCVPKAWTQRRTADECIYEGSEGSLWRSRHGLLHASKGRNAPQVHELVRDEIGL